MPPSPSPPPFPAPPPNPMAINPPVLTALLNKVTTTVVSTYLPPSPSTSPPSPSRPNSNPTIPPLATPSALQTAKSLLSSHLDDDSSGITTGLGVQHVTELIVGTILPALGRGEGGKGYYGFVTGGTTPAALLADNLVTLADANVQVHLPLESISTILEDTTLSLLLTHFLHLPSSLFPGRIFTTGATAANILGLTCAREFIFQVPSTETRGEFLSVGELGILEASRRAGITGVDVLSAAAHASTYKAAGVLGIGKKNVIDVSLAEAGQPWEFDMARVKAILLAAATGDAHGTKRKVVINMSCGEVNSGKFTSGIRQIRKMVDRCNSNGGRAWIHVDGAFGIFARFLLRDDGEGVAEERFQGLVDAVDGLECADSITADGHKMLNAPYDCGIFYTRHPELLHSCLSAPAAYLAPTPSSTTESERIQHSPLTIGLENSRRFRALPVYASLLAYGVSGYRESITHMILHARGIAKWIAASPDYELLPEGSNPDEIFTIVLFRAVDRALNVELKQRINFPHGGGCGSAEGGQNVAGGTMYASGTVWDGLPAMRIAVSNWRMEGREDGPGGWGVVTKVLQDVSDVWKRECV